MIGWEPRETPADCKRKTGTDSPRVLAIAISNHGSKYLEDLGLQRISDLSTVSPAKCQRAKERWTAV